MNIFSSLFSGILSAIIGFTGDWFIAIALLTAIIKIALFPLSVKQQRGLLLTQRLGQAKELLEKKFKKQSDRVNAELVKIMGKYKANPLSSMMVMLVQIPVFFSLYFSISHLSTTIGSVIIPWVLSVGKSDALHILPIAASAITGLQGFFGQPGQVRNILMVALPTGIGLVFLWHAPVGLSVYWGFNALLGLVERWIFSLRYIREKYLVVPTADEMVEGIA